MFPAPLSIVISMVFLATSAATLFARIPRTEEERRIAGLYRVACNALAFAGILMVLSTAAPTEQRSGEFLGGGFVLGLLGAVSATAALRSGRALKRRAQALITGQLTETRWERRRRERDQERSERDADEGSAA